MVSSWRSKAAPIEEISTRVEISSIGAALLLHNETIVLGAKCVDLEHVCSAAIVVRIDEDFEVVVQVLAHVPAKFRSDDPRGLGVKAMNPEIHGMPSVDNAYLRLLGWCLTFVGLTLAKISDGVRRLPNQVIQGSVEPWGLVDAGCFCANPHGRALRGWSFC